MPGRGLLGLWLLTRLIVLAGFNLVAGAGDGVIPLTFRWAHEILSGRSPYHDRGVGYAPLAMIFFALLGIGAGTVHSYTVRFVAAMLTVDLAGLCLAVSAERRGARFAGRAYIAGLFCAGPILLFWRYDLIPAVVHLAAAVCLLRGRRRASWALLGLGIAFKPYLLILVPVWAVWEIRSPRPTGPLKLSEATALVTVPSFLAAAAMMPFGGLRFLSAYSFQASRGLQVESGPAVFLAEMGRNGLSTARAAFAAACLCWERTGPAAGAVRRISTLLVVIAVIVVLLALWRKPNTDNVLRASCAVILALLVFYRVFSPQYVIWALVPLALLVRHPAGAAAAVTTAGAALAAAYLYPLHYGDVINYSGPGRWLLVARTVALAVCFVLCIPSGSTSDLRKI